MTITLLQISLTFHSAHVSQYSILPFRLLVSDVILSIFMSGFFRFYMKGVLCDRCHPMSYFTQCNNPSFIQLSQTTWFLLETILYSLKLEKERVFPSASSLICQFQWLGLAQAKPDIKCYQDSWVQAIGPSSIAPPRPLEWIAQGVKQWRYALILLQNADPVKFSVSRYSTILHLQDFIFKL